MQQRELPFPLEKWLELLARARADGIVLIPMQRSNRVMLATSSAQQRVYQVDGDTCTCKAGDCGVPCKHRALWIHDHLGEYADSIADQSRVLIRGKAVS